MARIRIPAAGKEYKKSLIIYASVAVFVVSFLVYLPTLFNSFIWDDYQALGASSKALGGYDIYHGSGVYFRPFIRLLHQVDAIFWAQNPMGYHLTNILINSFAGVLVFGLSFMLLGNIPGALVSAALFILHPSHADSVAWVSGRTDIAAAIFFFLSLMSYLIFRRDKSHAGLALSCLFLLFSLFCKEVAVAIPLVAFSFDLLIRGEKGKALFYPQIFLVLTIGLYALLRGGLNVGEQAVQSSSPAANAAAVTPVFQSVFHNMQEILYSYGFYINKLFLPYNITLFPDTHLAINLFFAALFIALLTVAFVRRLKLPLFALLFFVFTLAPTFFTLIMSKIPVTVAVRYLYIPVFGLCLVAGYTFKKIPVKTAVPLIVVLSLFYAGSLHLRNMLWKDEVTLFTYDVKKNPDSAMAHMQYALSFCRVQQNDLAGIEIDYITDNLGKLKYRKEQEKDLRLMLISTKGTIKYSEGDMEGAQYYFKKTLDIDPKIRGVNFLLAEIMLRKYREKNDQSFLLEAHRLYEKELVLAPDQIDINYALGRSSLLLGQKEKAIAYFSRAAELDPENPLAVLAVKEIYKIRFFGGGGTKKGVQGLN